MCGYCVLLSERKITEFVTVFGISAVYKPEPFLDPIKWR